MTNIELIRKELLARYLLSESHHPPASQAPADTGTLTHALIKCAWPLFAGLWDGVERRRRASLLPSRWTFALSLLSPETHREWHNPSSCVPASLLASVADIWKPGQTACYVISLSPPSVDFLCMFFCNRQFSCKRIWEIFAGFSEPVCVWVPAVSNYVYLTKNVACYLSWLVYSYVPFSAIWRFLLARFGRLFRESTTCCHAYELRSCRAQLKSQKLACLPPGNVPGKCFLTSTFHQIPWRTSNY